MAPNSGRRVLPLLVVLAIGVAVAVARLWRSQPTRDAGVVSRPAATASSSASPNILLVLLDDAGYGQTGTFGGLVPTPTLDALARNGLGSPGSTSRL